MHPMDETDLSHTANLPYPLIGSKEEGLVFENRPAHRRAELVHAERRSVAPSNGLRVSTALLRRYSNRLPWYSLVPPWKRSPPVRPWRHPSRPCRAANSRGTRQWRLPKSSA